MFASLVLILAYIWFRFSQVMFGVAGVVAVIHDVLVTLGALALSAWLARIPGLEFLLIEPFKISLPIIAAFLTIIGYSLNDTIVIFDRIREMRGKSPIISTDLANSAINQTLSRTILTSLTVFIVVLILYAVGGEGIHGFAFALVVGVVAGSYSTIYIATPIVLWMNREELSASKPAVPPIGRSAAYLVRYVRRPFRSVIQNQVRLERLNLPGHIFPSGYAGDLRQLRGGRTNNARVSSETGEGQPSIRSGATAASRIAAGGPAGSTRVTWSGICTTRPVASVTSAASVAPEHSSNRTRNQRPSMPSSSRATVYVGRYSGNKRRRSMPHEPTVTRRGLQALDARRILAHNVPVTAQSPLRRSPNPANEHPRAGD